MAYAHLPPHQVILRTAYSLEQPGGGGVYRRPAVGDVEPSQAILHASLAV